MSDALSVLQQVAAQLRQEGKTPSLALFRSRIAGRVPPQQLFAAYQQWRNNPVYTIVDSRTPEPSSTVEPNVDETDLHLRLSRIEAKLDVILAKMATDK